MKENSNLMSVNRLTYQFVILILIFSFGCNTAEKEEERLLRQNIKTCYEQEKAAIEVAEKEFINLKSKYHVADLGLLNIDENTSFTDIYDYFEKSKLIIIRGCKVGDYFDMKDSIVQIYNADKEILYNLTIDNGQSSLFYKSTKDIDFFSDFFGKVSLKEIYQEDLNKHMSIDEICPQQDYYVVCEISSIHSLRTGYLAVGSVIDAVKTQHAECDNPFLTYLINYNIEGVEQMINDWDKE